MEAVSNESQKSEIMLSNIQSQKSNISDSDDIFEICKSFRKYEKSSAEISKAKNDSIQLLCNETNVLDQIYDECSQQQVSCPSNKNLNRST